MATRKKAAEETPAEENPEGEDTEGLQDEYSQIQLELDKERQIRKELLEENKQLVKQNAEIAQRNDEQKELIAEKESELKEAKRERKAAEDVNSSLKGGGVRCTEPGRYRIIKGKFCKKGYLPYTG